MNELPRDAQRLAAKLAGLRGISPDEALVDALRESVEKWSWPRPRGERLEGEDLIRRLEEISRHAASLPVLDPRSPEEILGYDEFGLPT